MDTACIGACIEVRVPSRFALYSALSGAICAFEVHDQWVPVLPEVKRKSTAAIDGFPQG
jgi:hypothetical protein